MKSVSADTSFSSRSARKTSRFWKGVSFSCHPAGSGRSCPGQCRGGEREGRRDLEGVDRSAKSVSAGH